ncbi:TetR/AcrR family transcriptional regulator [Paenibacillus alginolyticus]|uniref:TetR/AcrR family transcriptional regulator n=1 Tax=Paenibacillus alginolyticus TaxID=59839 RepID=A0ABT4GBH7_9BACL|nr:MULTISPECIES: TetR/AcrR family transcriptional regulator [Paenibacillus]MCY9664091.1 TetR/AcrR family transcriptional regulator [Paenibacillus alginolyticus]MCY9693541.1 TetR/AcrR family transcriptional regulator [Paenibacillus alginolyticus]MEC0144426.1 TetR/AcrR family transcriptional regulator [Paenibacillus alginolyticus]NRF90747.1 TetR/AcrR family transcriptional regulator [Paenibacillus frigoriresistens]
MDKKNKPLGRPRSSQGEPPLTQKILKTAIPLFLSKGYESVSMDDIAKECQVTKASLYYYYPSKSDLLTASMIQLMDNVKRVTLMRLSQPTSLRDRLLDITEAHLKAIDFDLHSFMRKMEATLSDEQMKAMRKSEQGILDALEGEFRKSADSGEIGPINARVIARAYTSLLMMGHARDGDGNKMFPHESEAAKQIIDILWHGLFPQ